MASRFMVEVRPLTAQEVEKASKELRESAENREQGLAKLRKLIKDEPDLVWNDTDDFLIVFLRPAKYHADSAFELIKRVCEFRSKHAVVLAELQPRLEEKRISSGVVNVLVDRDQEGRRILVVNCGGSWDPSVVSSDQLFRLLYLIHLSAILEPSTQVNGVVVIMDFKGMGMKQVKAFTPAFSMRLLTFIQDAMPLRLKAVHIVKQPYVFNIVFQLFKPFIKEKLKSRMFFHGDKMKTLHEHVSASHLPEDYGGQLPTIDYGGGDWYPAILGVESSVNAWAGYGYGKDLKK